MAKAESTKLSLDELATLIPKPVTALVDLPSKGLFYDPSVLTDGKVELTPMSAREEKLVAGMKGNNVEEVIDSILSRCIKSPILPDDLLSTDRFYLLLALRANSYGENYTVTLTCPHCQQNAKYDIKLPTELERQDSNLNDREPFEVDLPITKLKIGFRLLRGKDLKDIKRNTEKATQKGYAGDGDPSYIYRIAKQLISVNGKSLDMLVAQSLVERLPAKDCAILKNAFEEKTPGVNTTIYKDCVSCGRKIEADLPISAEFFRPQYGREKESNG